MKHRIYSFPLMAKGRQIHKQFTEEYCEPSQQEPDPLRKRGGSSRNQPVTHYSPRAVRMYTSADGPTLQGFKAGVGDHFSRNCSNLGFTKEKPRKADWSIESMRFLSLKERLGFSFRNSGSKLL